MIDFMKSENFIKLVYIGVVCTILAVGFVNKGEVIDLYKYTINVCN